MLEDRTIIRVDQVRLAYDPGDHPFHVAHAAAARANWADEIARQPKLFDGQVMLARDVDVRAGVLRAECHLVPYSTLLYWRRLRPVAGTAHIFAMALPVASDGAVIAGRMSRWTANSGMVYCASGSFDRDDIAAGVFDVEGNMRREVAEEAGLDLAAAECEPGYGILPIDGAIVIFRRYRFAVRSDALVAAAERHIAGDPASELSEAVAIHAAEEGDSAYARHMAPILASHFMA